MLAQALGVVAGYLVAVGGCRRLLVVVYPPLPVVVPYSSAYYDNETRSIFRWLGSLLWPATLLGLAAYSLVRGGDFAMTKALNAAKPRASLPEAKVVERG